MNKSGSDALGMNWSHSNATSRQAAYQANSAGTYFAAKIATTVTGGVWYLITVEWDGTNLKIYLNGSLEASTGVTSILNNPGAIAGALGQWQGNAEAGVVEESRFATSALGASWALADYNSQNDPATFVTFGATTPV
jgi:hypothetical protein